MLKQRAIVTFIAGPIALYLIYLGGWLFFIPLAAVLLLGSYEFNRMMINIGWRPSLWLILVTVFLCALFAHIGEYARFEFALTAGIFTSMILALVKYERGQTSQITGNWAVTIAGIIYFGWLGSHFFALRNINPLGWQWTMLALGSIWTADSFAYLVGRQFGKHKMTPRLSPKKSYEGYAGGIVFALIFCLILVWLTLLPLWASLLVSFSIAAIAPIGDLAISLLKREADMKDSGVLLPGHGGALDRIDSLLWAAPVAYYLITFLF